MFTHLHVHTEYSMLDGLSRIDGLVERAEQLGMDSLAITDHGGMYGAIDFYNKAIARGIKPIVGCEMYVAPGSRHDKIAGDKSPYHLTVLAQDAEGYRNLIKLVTKSHVEGLLLQAPHRQGAARARHQKGLIVLSGCPSGEVPGLLAQGRHDEAAEAAGWYRELLGERYFLELMEHGGVPDLPVINRGLLALRDRVGVPLVATNDSHYVDREDAQLQDIVICIHTNTNINDEKRLRMEEASYYLKSHQEMAELFGEVPEALINTERIAEMCDLKLDFSQLRLPQFPTPEGMTADEYLTRLCEEGLRRRTSGPTPAEEERLRYELDVIRHTQFADYFLVVWDIAKFVRERDIFFAVRGSAAASLALFCLGVTDVNPLEFDLVFERFLNMERKEMPDIDMDFQDDRREEVINYVVAKYGREHVAQIITFGTLGARASIRDVGRALGMSYADVDRVARLVPFRPNINLPEVMGSSAEFSEVYEADESIRNLIDTSMKLEGLTRHSSTHAAGVVISGEPLDDVVPLQRPSRNDGEGVLTTQYSMDPIAELGLLKMDFLGLANLTVLAKTRDLIRETRGEDIALQEIALDDAKTFETAVARRHRGRVPDGRLGHDPLHQGPEAVVAGRRRRHDSAVPSRADGAHNGFHQRQARARQGPLPASGAGRHSSRDLRHNRVPGPGVADLPHVRGLLARLGGHRAQGDGQEDRRDHGQRGAAVHPGRGAKRAHARAGGAALRTDNSLRGLRLQQGPQR